MIVIVVSEHFSLSPVNMEEVSSDGVCLSPVE